MERETHTYTETEIDRPRQTDGQDSKNQRK